MSRYVFNPVTRQLEYSKPHGVEIPESAFQENINAFYIVPRDYFLGLKHPAIRVIEVPVEPKQPLGRLRNISIEASRGQYIAQWDDDDWYAPARLAEQLAAIRNSGKPACVLVRWIMYDEMTGKAFLSQRPTWEGSLVALRAAAPSYPELAKGEDTLAIGEMLNAGPASRTGPAGAVVYVYHGQNTWQRDHWDTCLAKLSQPLAAEATEQVKRWLYGNG